MIERKGAVPKQTTYIVKINKDDFEFRLPENKPKNKIANLDWYKEIKTPVTVPHWTEKAYDK